MKFTPSISTLILSTLYAASAFATHGHTTVVVGTNDAIVDRSAVQAAVDAALPGDRIRLEGTFQFDGTPVRITQGDLRIVGRAIDNDHDGQLNEDWNDGIDNDGDGRTDEDGWDTRVLGLTDAGGAPQPDDGSTSFNYGFLLRGISDDVEHIRLSGIELAHFWRAVTFAPDIETASGLCADRFETEGSLRYLRIVNNRFTANDRSIEIVGDVRHARLARNRISGLGQLAMRMIGNAAGCIEADGSAGSTAIGRPTETLLRRNAFEDASIALLSLGSRDTVIVDNQVQVGIVGIVTQQDDGLIARGNDITGLIGIDALEAVSDVRLAHNRIDATAIGILIDLDASGYSVRRNVFVGPAENDILLDPTSSENRIRVFAEDVVLDLGTDNDVAIVD